MAKILLLVVLLLGCMWTQVATEGEGERTHFLDVFPFANEKAFGKVAVETLRYETQEPEYEPLPFVSACPVIPVPADTNDVNQLKPGHIKVVMSMGDSITAGCSAKDTNIALGLKEYRGLSYAIGGDAGVVTLPNLLAQYTPTGYPLGMSTGIGKRTITTNGLNAAVSGAINIEMHEQAVWLVTQLKAHPKINYASDWKVLTLWIGSNNICQVCNDRIANDAKDFERQIYKALDYLYEHVPRVFVNLMANMDVTKMYPYQNGTCSILHPVECPCGTSLNAGTRAQVQVVIKEYIIAAHNIAANFTARKNPEFAVVVQPYLQDSAIYDRTYLSKADCFHPSDKAHLAMSIALWNSMITPIPHKKTAWNPGESPICATKDTLLYTS